MNRLNALRIQLSATSTIVLSKLSSIGIGRSDFQLRSDSVQIALRPDQIDFQPVVRVAWMGIAIKPVGTLISAITPRFRADAVLDHQIKEAIVVIVCPSGSLVSRNIVL